MISPTTTLMWELASNYSIYWRPIGDRSPNCIGGWCTAIPISGSLLSGNVDISSWASNTNSFIPIPLWRSANMQSQAPSPR